MSEVEILLEKVKAGDIETAKPQKTKYGHDHAEAFMLMTYSCEKCGHREKIWNSRDGVTPFIIACTRCSNEAKHINWQADVYASNLCPGRGQWMFIDMPEHFKRTIAIHRVKGHPRARTMEAKEQEDLINSVAASMGPGTPMLVRI
jgi:hypothetical protein